MMFKLIGHGMVGKRVSMHFVRQAGSSVSAEQFASGRLVRMSLLGPAENGGLAQMARMFAENGIDVDIIKSRLQPAPEAGYDNFAAEVQLRVPNWFVGSRKLSDLRDSIEDRTGCSLIELDEMENAQEEPPWRGPPKNKSRK